MSTKHKSFIIGSGVAGMACAIRLAIKGFEVTVFQKNGYPGGKLYVLEKDGYRFDTGPSLFVQPQNIEELFSLAGEDITQYMVYKKLGIGCKYFYENGTIINAYSNPEKFAEEVQEKTGEPSGHVLSYLKESEKIYSNIVGLFVNYSLHKRRTWRKRSIVKGFIATRPGYLFSTFHNANKKKFNSPHVIQLFDRYATYNGSDPYKAPAMLKLIPHVELNEGS